MALYSYKGGFPAELPYTIFLANGTGRTNSATFTNAELVSAGYVGPYTMPVLAADQKISWDGVALTAVAKTAAELAVDLTTAKAQKLADLADLRWRMETSGIILNGVPVATDDRSKLLILGKRTKAAADPDMTFQWKAPTGFVTLTAAQMLAIADAVEAHVQGCFTREGVLAAQVEAATTLAELGAIDITSGWPA